MAGQDVPTLEESTLLIVETLRALRLDLLPTAGIGIAALPPDILESLSRLAIPAEGIAALHAAALPAYNKLWEATNEKLVAGFREIELLRSVMPEIRWTELTHALNTILPENIQAIGLKISGVDASLGDLQATLSQVAQEVKDGLGSVVDSMYPLSGGLKDALSDLTVKFVCAAPEAVALLLPVLEKIAAATGEAPKEGEKAEWEKIIEKAVEAVLAAIEEVLSEGEGHKLSLSGAVKWLLDGALKVGETVTEGVLGAVEERTAGGLADVNANAPRGQGDFGATLLKPLAWLTRSGVATPDTVLGRVGASYAFAVILGIIAHGISAVSSIRIFGSGALHTAGLAALVGKFAGFGPLVNAVSGTLYRNYISVPLNYYTNQFARPYLPGIGDLLRFKSKRIFDRHPDDPAKAKTPLTFDECMAYFGYSDEWIETYKDDLYREPGARDLLLMAEFGTFDDKWWKYKARRLGYSPDDVEPIVGAFKRRAARTQLLDLYRRLWYLAEGGFISSSSFRERAEKTDLPDLAIDFGVQSAEAGLELRERRELQAYATAAYDRDALTDPEFRDLLDRVFEEKEPADRAFKLARMKRFRRVYLTTPSDEARAAIPAYKRAFLAGRVTLPEYKAKLTEAGLEGDVVGLTVDLDAQERDRRVLAEFQRFGLPTLRDDFLHGLIDEGQYRAALAAAKFPPEHLPAAVALVKAQSERRQEGIVRAGRLAAYRTGYVIGLIGPPELDSAFEDAGVDADAAAAERIILDFRRESERQRRVDKEEAEKERQLEKERKERERERKERERDETRRRREADRAEKAREKERADAGKALAAQAKQAAAERRPGWVDEVDRLRRDLEAEYKRTGGTLPDDAWQLALDLEDAINDPAGVDPERVDELIGRIEQSLTRHGGVVPKPPPEAPAGPAPPPAAGLPPFVSPRDADLWDEYQKRTGVDPEHMLPGDRAQWVSWLARKKAGYE